ncbi:hypothetical protein ABZP36_010090 [Zizania latifolia]
MRDTLAHTLASRRLPEGVVEAREWVPDVIVPRVMPFLHAADETEPTSNFVGQSLFYEPNGLDNCYEIYQSSINV